MMNLDRDQFLDQCFVVPIVVVFAVPLSFFRSSAWRGCAKLSGSGSRCVSSSLPSTVFGGKIGLGGCGLK
jgi:hypothetical protein